jgi:mevalonate kinase
MIGKAVTHHRRLGKLTGGGKGGVSMAVDTELRRFVALEFLPLSGQDSREIHA